MSSAYIVSRLHDALTRKWVVVRFASEALTPGGDIELHGDIMIVFYRKKRQMLARVSVTVVMRHSYVIETDHRIEVQEMGPHVRALRSVVDEWKAKERTDWLNDESVWASARYKKDGVTHRAPVHNAHWFPLIMEFKRVCGLTQFDKEEKPGVSILLKRLGEWSSGRVRLA